MVPPPRPFLLFPLFVPLLIWGGGFARALEYQTLVVAPLSGTPPVESLDEEDLAWTVASEELSDHSLAGAVPASAILRLHHRDSLLTGNSTTPAGLLRLRLERDAARVSSLQAVAAAAAVGAAPAPARGRNANATRRQGAAGGFSGSVVSGLAQGSGEYFTRIGIGTPLSYAYMVLDTGSDVVWVQCAPCRRCYTQSDPIFDPRKSRSYASLPCEALLCRSLDMPGCDIRRRSCLYDVSYGDGSITLGDFSTETLTFRGGARIGRVAFGCGHDNTGLFVAAAGLLGLGRGRLSFPSQAGRRFGRRFSYCLVDRTSATSSTGRSSTVVFGDSAVPRSGVVFSPLVVNPQVDTFYYVELTGISVGGARVPGVLASDLRLDPATGRGGVIVDSGTSVTRLARPAYAALRDAFRAGAAGLTPASGFSLFDTCYDLSGKTEVKVPTVVMHLGSAGGATADLSLPAENYLIPVDTNGVFCFAFAGTDGGLSIIGNIQQQGFRVVFDGAGRRMGFAAHAC